MQLSDFDYHLPPELIAQKPIEPRHAARLLVVDRARGQLEHRQFSDLPDYLNPDDLLIANNSRVRPARLFGQKQTSGKMELLLLKQVSACRWEALVGGKRLWEGSTFTIIPAKNDSTGTMIQGRIIEVLQGASRLVEFNQPLNELLPDIGHVPLPPYIQAALDDIERYQTIYSRVEGSAAAPTAGLHFSPEVLLTLRDKGVKIDYVTLHVGLDTFKPVTVDQIEQHPLHSEWISLSPETAKQINETKLTSHTLTAIGTTSVRVLETAALRSMGLSESLKQASIPNFLSEDPCLWQPVIATESPTDLFIYPGFQYRLVDRLVTNFHLPKSSLLMLVAAFMGLDLMQSVYQIAIAEKYRFYSFGDVMFIL